MSKRSALSSLIATYSPRILMTLLKLALLLGGLYPLGIIGREAELLDGSLSGPPE